ncbi:hypothetical protein IWW34DRAFT_796146 [Fusarium oxysporum f. sp. albedinis]|nr:hypothetical protein IWW34DRAFT_859854 [Fusarium oxysporum f. sp. albedinis]KAI3571112.1 hypothetical protein IWW34DRAFT_796146 [Fusarium oxysporum f. sp. albedinis]KAJ0137302.1 hypothetical protein HZ326_19738 [Fusarium oxysporum f. sp. albedinis]KAK2470998.1 hypothetical protein H9L39_17229 [Fusarium oxysporum f. sp. albedinis]KAK2471827.1 hypothetical protein H9L39_16583 [Fusarium oxysporum f. sp. albedinis]
MKYPTPTPPNKQDNEISISHTWRHALAVRIENDQGELPCPVATQGAHLIPPPPTPAFHTSIPNTAFIQILTEKLNRIQMRQNIRIGLYSAEFADQWPISKAPRDLAKDAANRVTKINDDPLLALGDDTETDEEKDERCGVKNELISAACRKRMSEAREKRKRGVLLPSPEATDDDTTRQRRKRKRDDIELVEPTLSHRKRKPN